MKLTIARTRLTFSISHPACAFTVCTPNFCSASLPWTYDIKSLRAVTILRLIGHAVIRLNVSQLLQY